MKRYVFCISLSLLNLTSSNLGAQTQLSPSNLELIKKSPALTEEVKSKMILMRLNECIASRAPLSIIIAKQEYQNGALLTLRREQPDASGRFLEGTVFVKGAFQSAIAGEIGSKRCDAFQEEIKK